jgi:hypothetical protein
MQTIAKHSHIGEEDLKTPEVLLSKHSHIREEDLKTPQVLLSKHSHIREEDLRGLEVRKTKGLTYESGVSREMVVVMLMQLLLLDPTSLPPLPPLMRGQGTNDSISTPSSRLPPPAHPRPTHTYTHTHTHTHTHTCVVEGKGGKGG